MMIQRFVLSVLCLAAFALPGLSSARATTTDRQVADSFVRSALSFLTYSQLVDSDEPQFLAAMLLDAALELSPDNTQAWSLRAQLAEAAGDSDAYEQALVGYLDTGVKDDRAKFNLIRYRLAQNNTLDAQYRSVEDLLNSDAGQALSGPLRSQLASFASSVADELLDERGHRKWAIEAARADPANLQAAQTMLDLVTELGGNAVKRGTATVNVIRASPLAPQPRLDLAATLADHAAFEYAAQQYLVVSTRLSAQPLRMIDYVNWAHCLAMIGRDEVALQLIDEFEQALNAAESSGQQDPDADADQAAAAAVPAPLRLELVRLAVLDGEDEAEAAQTVFDRLVRRLSQAKADADRGDQDAEAKANNARNLALIGAVFAPDLDQAQRIAEANGADPVALGWIALRRGDLETARQLLGPQANTDPVASCGLALATGSDAAGKARLLQVFLTGGDSLSVAALAAGRAMLKLETPAQPTTTGKALVALMNKYPQAFWLVDVQRTPWLDVRMKIKPQRVTPLDPIAAEITLWNTSRFPLAIRETGPISDNAVLAITVKSSGRTLPPVPPIVVDLGKGFTLKAGERMILDTRIDYHQFGSLRANNPGVPFTFAARLIVNPRLSPGGAWVPSSIGSIADVRNLLIQSTPASATAIDDWLAELTNNDPGERAEALMRLSSLNRTTQPQLVTAPLIERVKTPLFNVWDGGNASEQAWILLNAQNLGESTTSFPDLIEKAKASKSKRVWLALLTTHAAEADAPLLLEAIGRQAELPDVARYAERLGRLMKKYNAALAEQEALREQAPAE